MTDKEQLKKIKEKYLENEKFWYDTYKEQVKLSREQIKKLQERVQVLEETVEDYKTVNKELHQRGRKVRKQNKRYREALEEIKKEETVTTGLSKGQVAYTRSGHIARKALEE